MFTERIRRRTLNPAERDLVRAVAADVSSRTPLSFGGDGTTPDVAEIELQCATVAARHGRLDLVVVDYLGLMRGALQRRASGDRQAEIAQVVADLQELATRLNAAVVIVEQLTRAPDLRDDHRPRLEDLCHGEALLGIAETVILLHRPAYYDPKHRTGRYDRTPDPELYPPELFPREGLPEPAVQCAELVVLHNRHSRTGTVEVNVELARARFSDRPSWRSQR